MVDKGDAFPGNMGLTCWLHSNYISRGSRSGKFSKGGGGVKAGGAGELHALQASPCTPPSWNKIWMLIAANRRGTLETLCAASFISSSLCSLSNHEIKCFSFTHIWQIKMSYLVFKEKNKSLGIFAELPWHFTKDSRDSSAISCCTAFILFPK